MSTARSNNNATQSEHEKPATSQWFRLLVPSEGHQTWMHLGKQSPATGYPGISLSSEANYYLSVVGRSHYQSGGPTVMQSVGEWGQFASAPMTLWSGSAMNMAASGGLMLSALKSATEPTIEVVADQGTKVPVVSTAQKFGDARKTFHDNLVQTTKDWVPTLASDIGTMFQDSGAISSTNYDGSSALKDSVDDDLLEALKSFVGLGAAAPDATGVEGATANEPGATSNAASNSTDPVSSRMDDEVFDLGSVTEGRPLAAGGIAKNIEVTKKDPMAGVSVLSDETFFLGTKKAQLAIAEGGFAFLAPGSARFHVVAGGHVDVKAGERIELGAVTSATLEAGDWAEMTGANRASVFSRNTAYVAAPTVVVGARDNRLANVLGGRKVSENKPTKNVIIETTDEGSVEIHIDANKSKVLVTNTKIEVVLEKNSVTLSPSGVEISSDKEIKLDAPNVKINGSTAIAISSMATTMDSDLTVNGKAGGKLEVKMGVEATGGGKLSVVAGMIKNL